MQGKRLIVAALLTVVGVLAALLVGGAGPTEATAPDQAHVDRLEAASEAEIVLPDEVLTALQADLDLTAGELEARLAGEAGASQAVSQLEGTLGADFGGAWVAADDAQLTVAITDADQADEVRAAGAEPKVVAHSLDTLDAARTALDRSEASAPGSVHAWYVDVETNQVVVEAHPEGRAAVEQFVADSGVDADLVRVEASTEQPQLLFDVRGGDAYFPGSSRCSVGFSVVGGFTTAGHCGGTGTSTSGFNGEPQGTVQGSVFPGSMDGGWVAVNSNWDPLPVVVGSGGSTVTVQGSQVAPVGSSICRSGSTTGWHCGSVQAMNVTVQYPQGTVSGLTQTSVCAEPGDSGGSYISGNQAQGMTSGGSGNCTVGGTTFFQPLNPVLSAWGLTLVTG